MRVTIGRRYGRPRLSARVYRKYKAALTVKVCGCLGTCWVMIIGGEQTLHIPGCDDAAGKDREQAAALDELLGSRRWLYRYRQGTTTCRDRTAHHHAGDPLERRHIGLIEVHLHAGSVRLCGNAVTALRNR